MEFEILIDDTLLNVVNDNSLDFVTNNFLLSLINDFEDGGWRYEKFNNFVWDNIAETALSFKEREALKAQPSTLLKQAAKNLRLAKATDDIGKGSELAEIVLYAILKHKYGALPIVPKIFYKQNTQDNAKGADSVHIVISANNDFTLWLGEAKFYNSIEDTRLSSIIESVGNALSTDKLKKENAIIVSVSELDQLAIEEKLLRTIKQTLSNRTSIDELKPRLNIPILLLHECSHTSSATSLTDTYRASVKDYHRDRAKSYFTKQIAALKAIHQYSELRFHLILFPVPEKDQIVDAFIKTVEFQKG